MAESHIPEPCDPIHLSEFFLEERRFPAVYLLMQAGRIVYVGQSKTLKWRIEQHLTEGRKKFDAVAYVACPFTHLLEIEGFYIRRYVPEYNDCLIANSLRRKEPWRICNGKGRNTFNASGAAAFLGLTVGELQSLPEGVIRMRKRRIPRSPKTRIAYFRADLEAALISHWDAINQARKIA